MSEMVQRVAKALQMPMVDISVGMTPQKRLELMARAAIEAMREPTAEMCASQHCKSDQDWLRRSPQEVWRGMIDEALR